MSIFEPNFFTETQAAAHKEGDKNDAVIFFTLFTKNYDFVWKIVKIYK